MLMKCRQKQKLKRLLKIFLSLNKENVIRIVQILKKIFIYVFLVLLVLISGVYIFINTNYGKKKLTETVQQYLSKKLQTSFTLGYVDYRLPSFIKLKCIYQETITKLNIQHRHY